MKNGSATHKANSSHAIHAYQHNRTTSKQCPTMPLRPMKHHLLNIHLFIPLISIGICGARAEPTKIADSYKQIQNRFQKEIRANPSNSTDLNLAHHNRHQSLTQLHQKWLLHKQLSPAEKKAFMQVCFELEKYKESAQIAHEILKIDPQDRLAHAYLILCMLNTGSSAEAAHVINQAVNHTGAHPTITPYLGAMGMRLIQESDWPEAQGWLTRYLDSRLDLYQQTESSIATIPSILPFLQKASLQSQDLAGFEQLILRLTTRMDHLVSQATPRKITATTEQKRFFRAASILYELQAYRAKPLHPEPFFQAIHTVLTLPEWTDEAQSLLTLAARWADTARHGSHLWDESLVRIRAAESRAAIDHADLPPQVKQTLRRLIAQVDDEAMQALMLRKLTVTEKLSRKQDRGSSLLLIELQMHRAHSPEYGELCDGLKMLAEAGCDRFLISSSQGSVDLGTQLENYFKGTRRTVNVQTTSVMVASGPEAAWILYDGDEVVTSCVGSSPQKIGYLCWKVLHRQRTLNPKAP